MDTWITLQALGSLGHTLLHKYPEDWTGKLAKLKEINWNLSNPEWVGRAMNAGRMSKSRNNIILTSNLLKNYLHLKLNQKEQQIEEIYLKTK